MTDLARLVEQATAEDLLPNRSQSRASLSTETPRLVDSLELADGAYLLIVGLGARTIAVPATVRESGLVRDPGLASCLEPERAGSFVVDLLGGRGLPAGSRLIDVDQSNDSVVLGESVVVKWQVDVAPSPAPSRLRMLAGLGITPEPRAVVEWVEPGGRPATVATAVDYLPDSSDGWTWAVDLVRALCTGQRVDAIAPFSALGSLVARMHLALAPAVTATWGREECRLLGDRLLRDLDDAVAAMDGPEGEHLRARRGGMRKVLDEAFAVHETPVIPIHGDLHVGQTLMDATGRVWIVDFDGNPLLTPEERDSPAPAARDVAGMLASIDHVARVVNYRTPGVDTRISLAWIAEAQEAFLSAYGAELASAGRPDLLDERLIAPLMVAQECREYVYAARHLPHWRYVPDAVITGTFEED